MGYKINKIILQNFKLFNKDSENKSFYVEKLSDDLQILTGQNGYGKSSIYDAIELVLTGKIERLHKISGRSTTFKDNLIANNKNNDLIVGLEMYDNLEQKYLSILKYIPKDKIRCEKEDNLEKWFDTYICEDEFKLEKLLEGNNKVENYHDIIYEYLNIYPEFFYVNYIQQQEPISFLKRKEEDRKDVIDELLKTDELKGEKYYYIEKKINNYKEKYKELKEKIISLKREFEDDLDKRLPEKYEYKKEFKDLNIDWDIKKYEYKKNELEKLISFIENYDSYKLYLNKEILIKYDLNEDILNKISYYIKYKDELDDIIQNKNKCLTIKNLIDNVKNSNWESIGYDRYIERKYIDQIQEIHNEVESINKIKKESNETLLSLDAKRKDIVDIFNNCVSSKDVNLNDYICPLCGTKYSSKNKLMESINSYTDIIANLLSSFDKDIKERNLKIDLKIKELLEELDKLFSEIYAEKSDSYDLILRNTKDSKEIEDHLEIIQKIGIDFKTELLGLKRNKSDIEDFKKEIKSLLGKTINTYDNLSKITLDKNEFDNIYRNYFFNDPNKVKLISIEDLKEKLEYLNYYYEYSKVKNNNDKDKKIKELKNDLIKIKFKQKQFEEMKKEYDVIINDYKLKIISKIEIPLYIYSGKILQNHPMGLGIFCYLGSGNKITRLKFLGNMDTSHDIVNTFSSGQLAGFIISFTLAMKKVHSNNLDVILIDDPVQTMDELNLISFTEILRNEFSDKQVIMSTHESNIAGYIDYKYKKYHLHSSILDVRKRFK